MSSELRLNKGVLRERLERLRLYQELLPTLRLRQRRLRAARDEREAERRRLQRARDEHETSAEPWRALLRHDAPAAEPFVAVRELVRGFGTIAGVEVPMLEALRFGDAMPSRLAAPPALDDAIAWGRHAAELRARAEVVEEQHARIEDELRRATQRINLYEEVLIPQTRAEIRRLRVYLGDQRTAAVCRAKIAKRKLVARVAAGGIDGHR